MEIRLKIWELAMVALGFLLSGTLIGLMIAGEFNLSYGMTMLGLFLFPTLTLISKKRYKKLTAEQIKSLSWIKRNQN